MTRVATVIIAVFTALASLTVGAVGQGADYLDLLGCEFVRYSHHLLSST